MSIYNDNKEAAETMSIIHRAVYSLSKQLPPQPQNQKMLWPPEFMKGMPYFVLTGKDLNGKHIFVTPTEVFFVITSSIKIGDYSTLATRALMMQKIVEFVGRAADSRAAEYNVFRDPTRSVLMMAAVSYVKGNVNCDQNPLAFDICFPFGRSLTLSYEFGDEESNLVMNLTNPKLFLSYEVSEQLNQRQSKVFTKLRTFASGDNAAPLQVTLNTFSSKPIEKPGAVLDEGLEGLPMEKSDDNKENEFK